MATANMRHFNSPEEIAKRENPSTAAPAQRGQGFRHFNSPQEVAKRTGQPVPPPVPPPVLTRQVIDVQPEPQSDALALREQMLPLAGPLTTGDAIERLEQLERFVYALLDDPREAREWRLQLHNIGATVEAQGVLANKVRAVEQTVDQLVAAANIGGGPLGRRRAVETALDRLTQAAPTQAPAGATTAPAEPAAPATPPATPPTP